MNTPENTDKNNLKQFVFPRCLDCGCEFTEEHYRTCSAVKDAEDAEDRFLLMVEVMAILPLLSAVLVSFLIAINAINTK